MYQTNDIVVKKLRMNISRSIQFLSICAFTLLVSACGQGVKNDINFYYWKTNVSIGDTEKKYFEELGSKKLYIRYFDVYLDKNNSVEPKAKMKSFDTSVLNAEYVPTVFIVNEVFKNENTHYSEDVFVGQMIGLINMISEKNNINHNEIQIDCDWTASTKDRYFSFLKRLKERSKKDITCTLRLHQIKDKDVMGIPPVSKGYLMCYATSSPKDANVENSILDLELLRSYTKNIETYPLPFAVALPIYSWGVVTNHLGNIKLINNIDLSGISDKFIKKTGDNTYEVLDDFFLEGLYLSKGFTIRVETISPQLLQDARNYLDKKINKDYEIVYYHLDKPFLENYTINELK